MRKLLFAAVAALLLVCPRVALADNSFQPQASVGPVTISGQCLTPAAGCPAGTAVTIPLGGRNSVSAQVVTSNFTGTLAPFVSMDGGATWYSALARTSTSPYSNPGAAASSTTFSASTTTTVMSLVLTYAGVTDVMFASTAPVTNTLTVQAIASNTNPNPFGALISAKGTQAAAAAQVQEMKDASRSFVVLGADGVTPAIAETLITFSQNKAGTVTGSATSYAITSTKTLRLESLTCSLTAGAATNRVRVAVRLNTAGACTAASGLLMPAMELSPAYGTAAASQGGAFGSIQFPDGLELTGASWNVCLSESAAAASGTLTCTLVGFEY